MSNFFIAVAVFLITVIGALFAVPYFIDWNGYRGVFEEEATRLLGREVRVGGAVNLHLLPTPYFRFEKVRIADTSVNLQEPFFRAESLTIKLSIPPILRGVVEANEIELQRPVLRLALDANDGWNWQSFGEALGSAAFLPATVALSSVRIADGVLAVHGADGAERTRFERIAGELSAPSLAGPYRFRGSFVRASAERELRVATARPEPDGSVRFKATLRPLDGASTYTLDGRLADLMGKPRIDGELTARLPISGLWQAPRGQPRSARQEATVEAEAGEAAFDLKAAVSVGAGGAALANLALSFEQDGRPQLVTGELKASWRDEVSVDMNLSSHWLDLDRIAGAGERPAPLDSIVPLAGSVRDLVPAEGRFRATLSVEQANLGREAVSGLRLALARTGDNLEIEEFRLGMPGGTRADLQGALSGPPGSPTFAGSLSLRGASLLRFLAWATTSAVAFDARGDGAFGVRARIAVAPGQIVARNMVGDLSGTAVHGSARYQWEGRPALTLDIDSPQLDARAFIPPGASLADIAAPLLQLGGGPASSPAAAPASTGAVARSAWRPAATDIVLRLNAGLLVTAGRTYRDVAAEVELKSGRLRLPLLKVAGDDGFSLELEGDVDEAATRPKGRLRGAAGADTVAGIKALAELIGVPEALRPDAARAQVMLPLRLAGSLALGTRLPTSADLMVDGELNGSGASLKARLDGGQSGWRTGPADLTAVVDSANAGAIAALLTKATNPAPPAGQQPGRILLKATGIPAQGLATLASADAGDVAMSFRGQVVAAEAGNRAVGDLEVRAADATRLAALAGLSPPLRLDAMPVSGSMRVALDGKDVVLERLGLRVGGSDVRGRMALSAPGDRRRLEARLDVDELSLASLLTPLLDQRLAVTGTAESVLTGRRSVWPDVPFDGSALDVFEGSLQLSTPRLVLAEGLTLDRASLDMVLSTGRIEVRRLEGSCLGGLCSAALRLDKVPAGVEVTGRLRLAGLKLEVVGGSAASGTLAGELAFAGKGTSPRAVMSVLQGGATIELADARLANLWPGAIAVAAGAALQAEPDNMPKVLRQALGVGLSGGQLALPARLEGAIADGHLTVKPFAVDTAEGRASGGASLDLKTLAFESDWRLEARSAAGLAEKAPLPGVTVSYRGAAAALGALAPRIDADALERELAVRRMEKDVEELERLRKLDETRRREEAERQRRQFEDTPAPPAVAPPGRVPPAGPVPVAPAVPPQRPAAPG